MSLAGVNVAPRHNLLQWQKQWLQSDVVFPESDAPVAERYAQIKSMFDENLDERPLFGCCQDLVDKALASKNRMLVVATLDYICIRQRFCSYLFNVRASPLVEIQRQMNFGWYWQLRLQSALDGKTLWLH